VNAYKRKTYKRTAVQVNENEKEINGEGNLGKRGSQIRATCLPNNERRNPRGRCVLKGEGEENVAKEICTKKGCRYLDKRRGDHEEREALYGGRERDELTYVMWGGGGGWVGAAVGGGGRGAGGWWRVGSGGWGGGGGCVEDGGGGKGVLF